MKNQKIDPIELANNVKDSMQKLLNLHDSAIAKMPDEERKKIEPIQADIYSVLRAVKDGDINKINEISSKYANSNFNKDI